MKEPANGVIEQLWAFIICRGTGVRRTHIWKPWTDMRNRGRREREKESKRQEQHKATGGMSGLLAHSQFFQRTGPGEELCIIGYERVVTGTLVT